MKKPKIEEPEINYKKEYYKLREVERNYNKLCEILIDKEIEIYTFKKIIEELENDK